MKTIDAHTIDLTNQKGNGDFPCPRCQATISPDDKTEETYSIIGTKIDGLDLKELVVRCNRCRSFIHLTGFALLRELCDIGKPRYAEKEDKFCYVNHV